MINRILASVLAVISSSSAFAQKVAEPLDAEVTTYELRGDKAVIVVQFFSTEKSGDNKVFWSKISSIDAPTGAEPIVEKFPEGFRVKYRNTMFGGKSGEIVTEVIPIDPGRYAMSARNTNNNYTDSFCFGAPYFDIAAGDVQYIGNYEILALRKMWDGKYRNGLRYKPDMENAKNALALRFPVLAEKMKLWKPSNGAQFDCEGDEFVRYDLPDAAVTGSDQSVLIQE